MQFIILELCNGYFSTVAVLKELIKNHAIYYIAICNYVTDIFLTVTVLKELLKTMQFISLQLCNGYFLTVTELNELFKNHAIYFIETM